MMTKRPERPYWLNRAEMKWIRKAIDDVQKSVDCSQAMVIMPVGLLNNLLMAAQAMESPPLMLRLRELVPFLETLEPQQQDEENDR